MRHKDASSSEQTADLLYGIDAIAGYLGLRERQARSLCDKGEIPTFRLSPKGAGKNRIVCCRKSAIDAWINARAEAATTKA